MGDFGKYLFWEGYLRNSFFQHVAKLTNGDVPIFAQTSNVYSCCEWNMFCDKISFISLTGYYSASAVPVWTFSCQ